MNDRCFFVQQDFEDSLEAYCPRCGGLIGDSIIPVSLIAVDYSKGHWWCPHHPDGKCFWWTYELTQFGWTRQPSKSWKGVPKTAEERWSAPNMILDHGPDMENIHGD